VALLASGTGASAHERSGSPPPLESPIERTSLDEGLREYVTEEAVTIANSAEFAEVRALWGNDSSLVDQIDYQLSFRDQMDYLSADVSHLADVLTERPTNSAQKELGLWMTDAEAVEFERRIRVNAQIDEIKGALRLDGADLDEDASPSETIAGVWQDHQAGGRIFVATTDRSASERMLARLPDRSDVVVVEQKLSEVDLLELRSTISKVLDSAGIRSDLVPSYSPAGVTVEVRSDGGRTTEQALLNSKIDTEGLLFTDLPVIEDAGLPRQTHDWVDLQPGLAIRINRFASGEGNCGWGFNGHTNSYNYLTTSGHCFTPSEIASPVSRWHSNTEFVVSQTHSGTYPRIVHPASFYLKYDHDGHRDAARLQTGYADDNCSHGPAIPASGPPGSGDPGSDGHCTRPMAKRAQHTTYDVGDISCAHLSATNVWRCGNILATGVGDDNRQVEYSMNIKLGDSGTGLLYSNIIDGLVTTRVGSTKMRMITAWDVMLTVGGGGFSFNCHPTERHTSAGGWGTCPSVNR